MWEVVVLQTMPLASPLLSPQVHHYAVHTPNRETFINSVISLLRTHNFNVLDLCFLYPGLRGSPMHDRWTFLN